MNISETLELLAVIQTYDHRTVSRTDGQAWSLVLDDMELQDAKDAVLSHFSISTDWIMPAHINAIVRNQVRKPYRDLSAIIPPYQLEDDPKAEKRWQNVVADAMEIGHGEQQSRDIANHQFGITEDEPREIGAGKERMESILADAAKTRSFQEHERTEQRAERKRQSESRAKRRAEIEDGEVAR